MLRRETSTFIHVYINDYKRQLTSRQFCNLWLLYYKKIIEGEIFQVYLKLVFIETVYPFIVPDVKLFHYACFPRSISLSTCDRTLSSFTTFLLVKVQSQLRSFNLEQKALLCNCRLKNEFILFSKLNIFALSILKVRKFFITSVELYKRDV